MNLIKKFSRKKKGSYTEEDLKEVYSSLGKMFHQPKRAAFTIDGSKISINLNEVGGAIPTADPFRISLHLQKPCGRSLSVYPASIWDITFQSIFSTDKKIIKSKYIFKGDKKLIIKLTEQSAVLKKLQGQQLYIRIPKENTSKIILTPARGIESEAQFELFISILKALEAEIDNENRS
ncbi:hypothetical protein [Aequorivita marina]|uniref:hypothetical protein n=1 Tax=Aequorivita marina TaxID=3073654 RepID=UPI002875FE2B|nr:hypothetical protein [Aequorivita sp. S2608]MDS1298000.1 hypothetical protein [Aequorivita sp. S2608]